MATISILLADDHAVVRQGLRVLISQEDGMEVVGEAENGRQAVSLARTHRPAVVLMDVAMPLLNGVEATRQIVRELKNTKVLMLSSYGDDNSLNQTIAAGASGFLVKQTAADEMLQAIREVAAGNSFFSPTVAQRLRERRFGTNAPDPDAAASAKVQLTAREAEVLQLIAEGFANKQIADELGISIKTVEKHRQQVLNKLNIHDVAGLTRHAVAMGIVGREMRPLVA
jgi:DNA-binding NarL/FixJ family response regulator